MLRLSHRGRFVSLTIVGIFVATILALHRSNSLTTAEGYYFGRLSDGRAIAFSARFSRTNATVHLHWDGAETFETLEAASPQTRDLRLEGDANDNKMIALEFRGHFTPHAQFFSGRLKLRGATKDLAVVATNVASIATVHRKRGLKIGNRGGGCEYSATWPSFTGVEPFTAMISRLISNQVAANAAEFVTNGYDNAWEGFKTRGMSETWEANEDHTLWWYSSDLVSLYEDDWEFTGGAHGNLGITTHNFQRLDGRAREFTLTNLFRTNLDWETKLSAICARELHAQEASGFSTPPFQDLSAGELSAFTIDSYGLTIHFSPYAVASWAEGSFHVSIPWLEIRSMLDTNGPARLIPNAIGKAPPTSSQRVIHPPPTTKSS